MKSVVLFSRFLKQGDRPIRNSPFHATLFGVPGLTVRAVVVDCDYPEAFDKAASLMRDGETVLNSIPIQE